MRTKIKKMISRYLLKRSLWKLRNNSKIKTQIYEKV